MLAEKMNRAFNSIALSTKNTKSLKNIRVELHYKGTNNVELNIEVYPIRKNKQKILADDIVFYNNKTSKGISIVNSGDTNQSVQIDFNEIPVDITQIVFVVVICNTKSRDNTFEDITDAYISLIDEEENTELCRSYISNKNKNTYKQCIKISKINFNNWTFNNIEENKGFDEMPIEF